MKTLNDNVAIEPIELDHDKGKTQQVATRFSGTDKTKRTLLVGRVAFDSKEFKTGQRLYFKSELVQMPFFREKLILKDSATDIETEFILVPEAFVVGIDE